MSTTVPAVPATVQIASYVDWILDDYIYDDTEVEIPPVQLTFDLDPKPIPTIQFHGHNIVVDDMVTVSGGFLTKADIENAIKQLKAASVKPAVDTNWTWTVPPDYFEELKAMDELTKQVTEKGIDVQKQKRAKKVKDRQRAKDLRTRRAEKELSFTRSHRKTKAVRELPLGQRKHAARARSR